MGLLKWALIFALLSLLFGIVGFGGIAAGFAFIAKLLFGIFLFLLLLFLILGLAAFRAV